MTRNPDILFMSEYIKNVLYFAIVRQGKVLKNTLDTHFFCIDNDLVYENYYSDFGPLNLGCVYKYCMILNDKLKQYSNKQTIVHYTSIDPRKKANAAFVLGCFGVLYRNLPPQEALKPLTMHGQNYRPFQDATMGDSPYTISLLDCLLAIKKANDLGFFNFYDFNCEEYDRLNRIQGGDLNWIVPGKFLAFIGPVDNSISLYHPPNMYIGYFLENDVGIVIRLNKSNYDGKVFTDAGIKHCDLFFPDGSCPPRNILLKFMQICEDSQCALAVHCKAGLGRTGSLIGCYLMKHYRMTAHEAIGWMRICRSGSVIGHQQGWLERLEPWLIKQGNIYRKHMNHDTEMITKHAFGIYSIAEKARRQRPMTFSKTSRLTCQSVSRSAKSTSSTEQAPSKATEEGNSNWRARSPKMNNSLSRTLCKREKDGNNVLRRGSGAGEPRALSPSPRFSPTTRDQGSSTKSDYSNSKNFAGKTQITSFQTSQGPVIKTINDAKKLLLESTMSRDYHERSKNPSLAVTSRNLRFSKDGEHARETHTNSNVARVWPSTYCSASRGPPTQHPQRRRLGRSPSPPQVRISNEQTRATNTPSSSGKLVKNASKTTLNEVLSRLKLITIRDGSVGAASLGAASLGARRNAPVSRQAPSVRSDERPLATQGDLLNSIKFQRILRDSLNSEKAKTFVQDKKNVKEKSIKYVYPNTNPGAKTNRCYESSVLKDSSTVTSKGFFGPPRPSSPKSRWNPYSSYY